MSTTGWRVGTTVTSQPRISRAAAASCCPLRGAPLALEHEAADVLVDRCQVAVQELLGQVRLGGDVRALTQLQRRLLRGRPVAAGAGDQPALVSRDRRRCRRELCGNRVRQPGDVLTAQGGERRDRAGVAGRVAVALLDGGRATTTSSQSSARALSARP